MLRVLSCIPNLGQDQGYLCSSKMIFITVRPCDLGHSILNVRIFFTFLTTFGFTFSKQNCLYKKYCKGGRHSTIVKTCIKRFLVLKTIVSPI